MIIVVQWLMLLLLVFTILSCILSFLPLSPVAIWGGPVPRVSGLHRGEYAAVTDETWEAKDFEK